MKLPTANCRLLIVAYMLLVLSIAGCMPERGESEGSAWQTPVRTTTPTPTFHPVQIVTASGPTPTPTPIATATPIPTIAPVAGASRQMPLPIDATIELLHWRITIATVVQGDAALRALMQHNEFNPAPGDDEEYVLVTLAAENNGDDQEAQNPQYAIQASVTGERHVVYTNPGVVVPRPFADDVPSGGRSEGQIAVIVPRDERNLLLMLQDAAARATGAQFVALDPAAGVNPDPNLVNIAPTNLGATEADPAAPGKVATNKDWQITVLETVRGAEASARIMAANPFTEPPAFSNEFVAVKVRMRSIADAEPDTPRFIDSSYFQIVDAQGMPYDPLPLVAPDPLLQGIVFAGGASEGWFAFEVPETADDLVLVFRSSSVSGMGDARYFAMR